MRRAEVWLGVLGVLVALVVAGCSGGGASTNAGGPGIGWQDDGATITGLGLKAIFSTGMGSDALEVSGIGSATHTSVTIALLTPTPLTPQTFVCHQTDAGQSVSVTYVDSDGGLVLSNASCKVVLTQVGVAGGANAIGTFEAVLNITSGGQKMITNGHFNLPLKN